MSMREKFISGKEEIAKNEVDMSKEAINASLEKVYDMMIDNHAKYVEEEANELYCDFFNRADPLYVSEHTGKMYASLKMQHQEHSMFTAVEVCEILATGLVTFFDPVDKEKRHRLFADELMNYRKTKVNVVDVRDTPSE